MGQEKALTTLTIRTKSAEERDDIRYVMREAGCARAAQAMILACRAYRTFNERQKPLLESLKAKMQEQNSVQLRIINELKAENNRLRKALQCIKEAGLQAEDILKQK